MLTYLSQSKQRYQAFAGQVTIPSLEHPAALLYSLEEASPLWHAIDTNRQQALGCL